MKDVLKKYIQDIIAHLETEGIAFGEHITNRHNFTINKIMNFIS